MLTLLNINNYTLVDKLNLELDGGMTTITGETGAGKSILLDALGLTLGDRADADRIRAGKQRAEIHATFDITNLSEAKKWLDQQELSLDGECLLRRVITADGRSRAYINGQPVTLSQIRELGEMLIDVHAQHEHQSLLKKETQRRLLDEYAGHSELAEQVREAFLTWHSELERYTSLKDNEEETLARVQLLRYQVDELDQLDIKPDEFKQLEVEQKTLANGEAILQQSHQLSSLCNGEDNSILESLNKARHIANALPAEITAIKEAQQLLASAHIQVEEAHHEIERHISSFSLEPDQLQNVEQRLSALFEIARKHHVPADTLYTLHANLSKELVAMGGGDADLDAMAQKVEELEFDFRKLANKLSSQRETAGIKLAKTVNKQLKKLSMEHAQLKVDAKPLKKPSAVGLEDIQLVISTNPGQPMKPLAKIASGGELSRISLAIQVVTAQTSTTPTIVFDEVDVGIGGATADVVGQLLRQLGEKAQVICVTHLAQVAGKAHHHLRVNKTTKGSLVHTSIESLDDEQKVEEIARMIGSNKVTRATLDHAKEILGA